MKEIHYFIAEDGTRFYNMYNCMEYELVQKLCKTTLRIYKGNHQMTDLLSEETHNRCTRVCVPDSKALEDMKTIREYTGFYGEIDAIGTWKYDDSSCRWVCAA